MAGFGFGFGFGLNPMHGNNMQRSVPISHAIAMGGTVQGPRTDECLVACRICDDIFTSSKALLDHFEVHLAFDEAATMRQLRQSHLSDHYAHSQTPYLFAANHSRSLSHPPPTQTNPHFFLGNHQQQQPPPDHLRLTRPFLNQLETTLLTNGMAPTVDSAVASKPDEDEQLDLTLKL